MGFGFLASIIALGVGFIFFMGILGIAAYVIKSLAYMKAFERLNYSMSWAAWVPFLDSYALADCIKNEDGTTDLWGTKVNSLLFNFWWLVPIIVSNVPGVGKILVVAANGILLGNIFKQMYERLEGGDMSDKTGIGIASGIIPIIAWVKFLAM